MQQNYDNTHNFQENYQEEWYFCMIKKIIINMGWTICRSRKDYKQRLLRLMTKYEMR